MTDTYRQRALIERAGITGMPLADLTALLATDPAPADPPAATPPQGCAADPHEPKEPTPHDPA